MIVLGIPKLHTGILVGFLLEREIYPDYITPRQGYDLIYFPESDGCRMDVYDTLNAIPGLNIVGMATCGKGQLYTEIGVEVNRDNCNT